MRETERESESIGVGRAGRRRRRIGRETFSTFEMQNVLKRHMRDPNKPCACRGDKPFGPGLSRRLCLTHLLAVSAPWGKAKCS